MTPGFLALSSEYADLGTLREYMGRCSRQVNHAFPRQIIAFPALTTGLAGPQLPNMRH